MTDQPAAPTTGPYTTDPDFLHEVVLGADGVMVADCQILPRDDNTNRANARLLAASWAMLEALENIENDDQHMPSTAWDLIQAAIAKARGPS